MSDKHLLTIGYVPKNCRSERIVCGDPSESGTFETTLVFADDKVSSEENKAIVKMVGEAWFNANHPLWAKIAKTYCDKLSKEKKLDGKVLAKCWAIFQDEASPGKGISLVAEDADCGEFSNDDHEANGRFYIRYVHEEDGEYYNEKVVLIK